MNLANKISLCRIFLVPIIAILLLLTNDNAIIIIGNYRLTYMSFFAVLLFIVAGFSDWLDGCVARKCQQVTVFGKFFDSIADKLLVNVILIIMSYHRVVDIWITLIFIARDFVIDALRQVLATKNVVMAANCYGKWKFAFSFLAVTIILLAQKNFLATYWHYILLLPLYISLCLSLFSAGWYFYHHYQYLK